MEWSFRGFVFVRGRRFKRIGCRFLVVSFVIGVEVFPTGDRGERDAKVHAVVTR
jgi:hypothetical protein